jgi:alpha,alpha-trehalase
MQNSSILKVETLGPLFEDVQRSGLMPDSKTFPDCLPQSDPSALATLYESEKNHPGFSLEVFLKSHFSMPVEPDSGYASGDKKLKQHLNELWTVLSRTPDNSGGTLIPLPFPYIVPGGRFREIYYWDSYFTMLGLRESGRTDIMHNMVDNFAWLIDAYGMIPNGNRSYYLGRSQPPFFALMVQLLAEAAGSEWLVRYQPQLEREYAFWMEGAGDLSASKQAYRRVVRMPDGAILNRYWDDQPTPRPEAFIEDEHVAHRAGGDPATVWRHIRAAAESGWDFSSRWFTDPMDMATIQTTDLVPVDLNCLLYNLENLLAELAVLKQDHHAANHFQELAQLRKAALQHYCWNESTGFYFDCNHQTGAQTERQTLSAVFPLFFGLASPDQATRVAQTLEQQFLHPGGWSTTLLRTGQQWDAPNGWAPLQWMVFVGLKRYGHDALANQGRNSWLRLNEKVYQETGKMMEKYNVTDTGLLAGGGEYPNQDGFGWTNGVYLALRVSETADVPGSN